MASTYSANLKIELIGTGEQSGTWGSTTNTNLGTALEEAIVGRATATFATDADLTLTLTNTNTTQIARAFALRLESSVSLTATRNLIVPAINKPYIINNQTTGGQSIVVKNATGSGVTIPNGKRVAVYNNGTDVLTTIDYFPTLSVGGTTIPTGKTLVDTDSSQTLTNKTLTSPSISGATLTDGTANGVLYLNGSKAVSSGSGLVFDGSNLGLGVTPSAWGSNHRVFELAGVSTAHIVAYVNGLSSGTNYYSNSGGNLIYSYTGQNATRYEQTTTGQHRWFTAPSGTAGNPISFTQAMTLDASGNLGIGTTSPVARLSVSGGVGNGITYTDGTVINFVGTASGSVAQLGTTSNHFLQLITNGTAKATLDSSGNLGLGVTPSAWGASARGFDIAPYMAVFSDINANSGNSSQGLLFDAYYNAGYKYKITNGYAGAYEFSTGTGNHVWKIAGVGTAGNPITFTQAMTLDASGNLGIGTSSPDGKLDVRGITYVRGNASTPNASLQLHGYDAPVEGAFSLNSISGRNFTIRDEYVGVERVRIDASGNVGINTSPSADSKLHTRNTIDGGFAASFENHSASGWGFSVGTASTVIAYFYPNAARTGGPVGSITTNGVTVSYNGSSDYRLKHSVEPMRNALQRIAALKPVTYKWNADNSDGEGFIAHELAEVCPQAVTGEKDAVDADGKPVYQGIDTSFLVATLAAAIQEQQAIITELRSRIEALESI